MRLLIALALLVGVSADPWVRVTIPTSASLRGLSAVDANIAWVSGTKGTVLITTDGGKTWAARQVPGAEKLDFRGIRAFDSSHAVIVSSGKAEDGQARIYRTSDGGQNWELVLDEKTTGIFFDAIAFWDHRHGIVVSDPVDGRFVLFTTDDAGAHWTQVPPANLPPALPNEGAFAASNTSLFVQGSDNVWLATGGASEARVFRSQDRGQTWKVSETPIHPTNTTTGLFSIAFRDALDGIAVGGNYEHATDSPGPNVILTDDGGITWRTGAATDPPGLFLSAVAYQPVAGGTNSSNFHVLAGGPGGAISAGPDLHWVHESSQNFNAIVYGDSATAWAAGPKGFVARRVAASE